MEGPQATSPRAAFHLPSCPQVTRDQTRLGNFLLNGAERTKPLHAADSLGLNPRASACRPAQKVQGPLHPLAPIRSLSLPFWQCWPRWGFLGSSPGFTGSGAALCSRTGATRSSGDFGVTAVLHCTLYKPCATVQTLQHSIFKLRQEQPPEVNGQ